MKLRSVFALFLNMMKIGLFTFGGCYAMLTLLEDEFVRKKKWLSSDEFLDMAAIAESTPGPIAINAATYIGYKQYGLLGALFATLGVCVPSFFVIFIISLCFDAFLSLKYVTFAFMGIRVGVIYLIITTGFRMFRSMKKSLFNVLTFSVAFVLMIALSAFSREVSAIYYILAAGALGLSVYFVGVLRRRAEK